MYIVNCPLSNADAQYWLDMPFACIIIQLVDHVLYVVPAVVPFTMLIYKSQHMCRYWVHWE